MVLSIAGQLLGWLVSVPCLWQVSTAMTMPFFHGRSASRIYKVPEHISEFLLPRIQIFS